MSLCAFFVGYALLFKLFRLIRAKMPEYFKRTFCGVAHKSADLLFGNSHIGAFRIIAYKMYCVKFTLRGAKTAAYTLVRVNIRCAASETRPVSVLTCSSVKSRCASL